MPDWTHIGIHRRDYAEHGYNFTDIHVRCGTLVDVRAQLAGCWDNRAGYSGGQETADKFATLYRGYLDAGYLCIFEHHYWHPYMRVTFQHMSEAYRNETPGNAWYCDPSYYLGSKGETIARAYPLFLKCQGKRSKGRYTPEIATPEEAIARFPKALTLAVTEKDEWGSARDYYVPGMDLTQIKVAS